MKVAITGGTGFVGRHVAARLVASGHAVVVLARGHDQSDLSITSHPDVEWVRGGVGDPHALRAAFTGVDAVVHCAGINRELGAQTYAAVHVDGTRNVVDAARVAGVRKLVMLSFVRARPDCGSGYHESKWAAEQLVRDSGVDHTVLKAGMVFGRGDHMLDHLSHALHTFPFFLSVGCHEQPVRPVSIHDLARLIEASLDDPRLRDTTVPVLGPEELLLSEAARRVGVLVGHRRPTLPAPVWFHRLLARVAELAMRVPLVSRAQVRMLAEGVAEPVGEVRVLPPDLAPSTRFSPDAIRPELPPPGRFTARDLRCCPAAA
jgi:NADH dehydrogenase